MNPKLNVMTDAERVAHFNSKMDREHLRREATMVPLYVAKKAVGISPVSTSTLSPIQEQAASSSGFSSICKLDSRTDSCILMSFDSLVTHTKEGNQLAGALLLEMYNHDTDNNKQVWIPKKLCCNLDLENGCVYVWDVFARENLADFISEDGDGG